MDADRFSEYLDAHRRGDDRRAKDAIVAFVASFADDVERTDWTWRHLPELEFNRQCRLRHELYEGVIFPVLAEGYQRDDVDSILWLAATSGNLVSAEHLWRRVGMETPHQLLRRAYLLAPDRSDVRTAFLDELLRGFAFADHEWPAGLLWSADEAPKILEDVVLARTLAAGTEHEAAAEARLDQFEARVVEYRDRVGRLRAGRTGGVDHE